MFAVRHPGPGQLDVWVFNLLLPSRCTGPFWAIDGLIQLQLTNVIEEAIKHYLIPNQLFLFLGVRGKRFMNHIHTHSVTSKFSSPTGPSWQRWIRGFFDEIREFLRKLLVPRVGVEPTRPYGQRILSP